MLIHLGQTVAGSSRGRSKERTIKPKKENGRVGVAPLREASDGGLWL